ncbi:MAG: hypothetical protein II794_05145 [Oscillospiraceae bacterium]|nr:hypothetical protein [Oscillospiraceae bacterium]
MKRVILSENAHPALLAALKKTGRELHLVSPAPGFSPGVGDHADLRFISVRGELLSAPADFAPGSYPGEAAWCALVLGNYLVHRLDITAPQVLDAARAHGLRAVNVSQGYARCSALPVGEGAVITADRGIASALRDLGDVEVLEIRPGFVSLPPYETGFLGGCAGQAGDTVYFNGDILLHPDGESVCRFIRDRGLEVFSVPGAPLRDIGSIIEYRCIYERT